MQQRRSLPATEMAHDRRVIAARGTVPDEQEPATVPVRSCCGCSRPNGLSPDAAARPGAMARLILRRVGITPLLSLPFAALLAIVPIDPAAAQLARSTATARVVIQPQAVQLERGQVTLIRLGQPIPVVEMLLSGPMGRPCLPQDNAPVIPPCRMIITDLP